MLVIAVELRTLFYAQEVANKTSIFDSPAFAISFRSVRLLSRLHVSFNTKNTIRRNNIRVHNDSCKAKQTSQLKPHYFRKVQKV